MIGLLVFSTSKAMLAILRYIVYNFDHIVAYLLLFLFQLLNILSCTQIDLRNILLLGKKIYCLKESGLILSCIMWALE